MEEREQNILPTPPSSHGSDTTSPTELDLSVKTSREWNHNPKENYKMSASPRGICLIINNIEFEMPEMLPLRKGSDMDAFKFKNIFRQFGFSVESKRNLTSDKMRAIFKTVAARCNIRHDALFVILLSHGTESGIYGTDGLEVGINDIISYFDNRKCRSMMNKPKVFIVQACRGRKADYGVTQTFFSQPESQLSIQSDSQLTQVPTKICRYTEVNNDTRIPTRTDMLLCFSCQSGFVSTRNEEEGSWLGASLAEHLQNQGHIKHLTEILNMVSRDLREKQSFDGYKQVLEITTIAFDKHLYFNPGLAEDDSRENHRLRHKSSNLKTDR